MKTQRVVIAGGGVVGLCTAYYALKRGFAVRVLDAAAEGGRGCSSINAGMIVPSHFIPLAAPGMIAKGLRWMLNPRSPFFIRPRVDAALARWGWLFFRHANAAHVAACGELLRDLNLESRRLFCELDDEESFGLVRRGLLMLCATAKGLDEEAETAHAAHAIGLRAEVLDAAAAARLDPDVTMRMAGAVYFPDDCHLDPDRFLAAMRKRIAGLGGVIEYQRPVDRIETANGRATALWTGGARHAADHFVIACGAWMPRLLRTAGIRQPMQAGKGYSLTLAKPRQLPQLCSIFAEAKVAITPMGGKLRFGGTMEVGGLDLSVNPERVRGIIDSVPRYFPAFSTEDFAGAEPSVGLRPVSPDGLPYLGRTAKFPNLLVSGGHAMMGLSLAPVSGRLVADLLAGDEPFRPTGQLAPGRF